MYTISNIGKPRPPIRIRLREDSPCGIALDSTTDLLPGEVADVEFNLAMRLINTGRATRVVAESNSAAPTDAEGGESDDDLLEPSDDEGDTADADLEELGEEDLTDEELEELTAPGSTEPPQHRDPRPSRRRGR